MNARIAVAIVALALAALSSQAGELRVGKFKTYDAGDFVIVSSRDAGQARRFVEDLARFRVLLEFMLGKPPVASELPTTILIASASDWKKLLRPREGLDGVFQSARFANYIVMNGDAPLDQSLQLVLHEYTHYYLRAQFSGDYPPWFDEGLAEFMGSTTFDKEKALVRVLGFRLDQIRASDWIPFDRLIRVSPNDPEYLSHELMAGFYAQSWLTMHYGLIDNPEFGAQILAYLKQVNQLVPLEAAARNSFGGDLAAVDRKLREYSRRRTLNQAALPLGPIPPVSLSEGVALDEPETLAMFASVLLEMNVPPDRIRPLVDALQRREPDSARTAVLMARLAQRASQPEVFEQEVTRAESRMATGDWLQRRELGKLLLLNALEGDPMSPRKGVDMRRDLQRAWKWFDEALGLNEEDLEAMWGYGTAAVELNRNLPRAEQLLLDAFKRAPSNVDIALSLANLKAQQDHPAETVYYLKSALRHSGDLELRRWTASYLAEAEKRLVERQQVDEENRKRKEEYERQLAEYDKKYGKPKKRATQ